ncbi:hypothetical protein [uncultured Corynebacterium sp.]|uniref:hypothetical protein n=1 Tax=uncultured Corynebacterium sp. TaxID=159447 RepID=UPI00288B0015|nr:hypothetical protein [uncultured Corynebacterium sp.]
MKKLPLMFTAIAVALSGCSHDTEPAPAPTSTSITSTTEESSTAGTVESTEPSITSEESQPEPVHPENDAPIAEQATLEPTVIECLEGTPGPARWSDGTVSYSQWCFDTRGGEQYLENEHQAGLVETEECVGPAAVCGYGTADNGARNPTSGEIQTYHGCQDGYINDPHLCSATKDVVHAADPDGSIY